MNKKVGQFGHKTKTFHHEFAVVLMRLNAAACACAFAGEGSFSMQQEANAVKNNAEIRSSSGLGFFF